MLDTVHHS